ncbi:hypothetical protein F4553_007610 [Allocatelliglobosispora scoriae]|uniref:Uncharacterized protein n=1 Tax=Allocatelliglobosispora scoriae TaxID=643052 RepID=A0A841C2Q0_9ACTN|nr:peptidogalycan biosysnthesis protein [Allocatelliglobosispora scoriae]MBB5874176.1 hypothetical protein [Allocatelliglobosispora scoriae]
MTASLTVSLHDPHQPVPPSGWTEFIDAQRLIAAWSWSLVVAAAAGRVPVVAGTIHDGTGVVGLVTGRFIGPRVRRGARPVAGIVDIDSLTTSALPGIVLAAGADRAAQIEAVAAVRLALRREHGRRVRAIAFRQILEPALPTVLRWPAVVREGGSVTWFPNTFDSFDAYLASLKKKRRGDLRRIYSEVGNDTGLTVTSSLDGGPRPEITPADLCALTDSVVNRHHRTWWLRRRYLSPVMATALLAEPGTHLRAYRDGSGRLIAVHLVFDHHELPMSAIWGAYTVDEGGRRDLWYHSHAELTRWCVETGRQGFLGGQGSLVEKARLGQQVVRQWAVLIPQFR